MPCNAYRINMRSEELNFDLPAELIAQEPPPQRQQARLLHYQRHTQSIAHRPFTDFPSLLRAGDLLVFNDTQVIPARFGLRKPAGGYIDCLYLHCLPHAAAGRQLWRVMLKNAGTPRPQEPWTFDREPGLVAHVQGKTSEGEYDLLVFSPEPAASLLDRVGRMPLPPYIKRDKQSDKRDELDRSRYQSVLARRSGAIAAPTASLHFTEDILRQLDERGVRRTCVTLHVGAGTFKPLTADRLPDHAMHTEAWRIDASAAAALNSARLEKRRIIAIGTTAARVLESWPKNVPFEAAGGNTDIFIYPPYHWKYIDALLTNFHLPQSTLIALVAAFTGLEAQRRMYRQAIAQRYRFFSYGDAMFIE